MAEAKKKTTVGATKKQIKPTNPTPEPVATKVEEVEPSDEIKVTRSVHFFNRSDVVKNDHGEKHLVRYLGVERYWSIQQIEICLRDETVTLVTDGSIKDPQVARFLEFPKKTQISVRIKERRPCIGCGRS